MKKKRIVVSLIVCIVLLFSTIFAGCEKSDGADGTEKTTQTTKKTEQTTKKTEQTTTVKIEPVTLNVLIPGVPLDDQTDPSTGVKVLGLNTKIKPFTDANPQITVVFNETPWENAVQKATTMSATGEVDVLAGMGPYIFKPLFDEFGWTADVTDLYNRDKEEIQNIYISDFSTLMEDQNGKVRALLVQISPFVITYNKQLFDDFGVEYLSEKPTVDELLEKVSKLTGKNPKTGKQVYGWAPQSKMGKYGLYVVLTEILRYYGWRYVESDTLWYASSDPKTAKVLPDNDGKFLKATEKFFELMKFSPPGAVAGEGNENYYTEEYSVAIQLPTQTFGPYEKEIAAGNEDFYKKYGVTTALKSPETGRGGDMNSIFTGMTRGIDPAKKEAAWKLMKFFVSLEWSKYYYTSSLMPIIQKGGENFKYPADKHYNIITEHLRTLPPDKFADDGIQGVWEAGNAIIDDAVAAASGGSINPQEAVQKALETVEKMHSEWLKKETEK